MSTRSLTLNTAALLAFTTLFASAAVKSAALRPQQQFQQPSVILTGSWPAGIESADLNGDGRPDLIYTDYGATATSSTTHILLSNGDGTFTPGQTIATAGASIAVADFDRDGHPDLEWVWSVEGEGRVYFAHGNGDGTFAPTVELGTFAQIGTNLPQLIYVTAAPMHDTGYLDLLVEDTANSSLFELTAGPSNTLIRLFGIHLPDGTGPMATADLNGDGHTDLIIQSNSPTTSQSAGGGGVLDVFYGSANGLLTGPATYPGPSGVRSFLLQDIDADGHPDLVIEGNTGTISILHGFPDGTFSTTSEGGTNALSPATGAGGHLISITGPASAQRIYTATPAGISLLQSSNLSLTLQGIYNAGPGSSSYVVADFNNDGIPDLALDSPEGIAILFGNPDGTLQTSLAFSANQPALSGTLGSFTGSGNLDALVTTSATEARLLPGHGDGTFGPPTPATPPTPSAAITLPSTLPGLPTQPNLTPTSIITADLDNDGNPDIIATFDNPTANHANPDPTTPNQIYIWYGSANGTYSAPTVITPTRNFSQVTAADMSNDGQLDLVLTDGYLVAILHNLGNRTFGTEQHILAGAKISSISTGDLNRDGTTDLVISNGSPVNSDVATGGITVLLSRLSAKAVTGSLTSSPNTTAPGQTYTITAAVRPMSSGAMPAVTGTVTFALDGAPLGTVSVSAGIATITGPGTAPVGTHTLTAQYSGDNTYAATQLNTSHAVTGISTTIILSITTGAQIFYGQTVDGIAQAQASDQSQLTGTITFYDGANSICSIPVTGNLSCPPSAGTGFTAGIHSLTAVYSGDTTHSASTSNIAIVTVLPDTTTATLTTSLNPAPTGQSVSLTATLSGNFAIPTGPVTFVENTPAGPTVLGAATLNSAGTAVLTTSALTAGTHSIAAVYNATRNFNAAASPTVSLVITPATNAAATAIMISSSANPAPAGQTLTLTANVVTTTQSTLIPTGTVTFIDGNTVLGTATLNPSGLATFTTSTLAAGTHGISASYAGNAAAAPSLSSVFLEVITPGSLPTPVSFIIGAGSTSVETGGSANILVRVSPENGFNQAVQLTCANLPAQATCTFAASTIAAGGGTTTMKLTTLAPADCGSSTPYGQSSSLPYTGPVLAGLLIFLLPKRRRALKGLLILLAMTGALTMTGCGACTNLGTRPGTYTIQITGTSLGSNQVTVTQSVQITVTE